MARTNTYATASGKVLTDDDIEELADDVATHTYPGKVRWRGRPALGSGPSKTVPVRLDPELHHSLSERAKRDRTTASDVVRTALREYLAS